MKTFTHIAAPRRLALLALLCLAVSMLLLVGCTDPETPPSGTDLPTADATAAPTDTPTNAPTDGPTEPETPAVTEAPTDAPTETEPEGWKPDMGKFNEGKVDYVMEIETVIYAAYPDSEVGRPMTPGDAGVVSVMSSDFEDGDVFAGDDAAPRTPDQVKVVDGKIHMPYSADSDDHLAGDGWTTWYVTSNASFSTYKQSAFNLKWDIRSKGDGAWMSAVVGCYLSNPAGKIPDGPGDGLWISYQENASELIVYHPDNASWPAAWSHIPVAEGLMAGTFETTVLCTPDRTTHVYITPEGGTDARLVAKIVFADGKIRTYNEEGTMIDESDCTLNAVKGEGYSVFVHGGGAAVIEEASVLAASKGNVEKQVTVTATPTEGNTLGLDITDKQDLVSICYSVWFDAILGSGSGKVDYWNNISESLAGNQPWGGVTAFHYWAKPALGYYRSSDKEVIRTHMTQLYTAGVDFIIIDLTNAGDGYLGAAAWNSYIQTPMDAICDTIMEMRAEGKGTPYVVYWVGDGEGPLYKELYDKYYNVDKWKDCFVYWDGKPFMLTTHKSPADFPYSNLMTVRSMWGLGVDYAGGQWSFLSIDNNGKVTNGPDGTPEQVSVAMASQETYMSMSTAHGREGGVFWSKQWHYAFKVHPKIVTLTWWNEWTAQRFEVDGGIHFVDNYTPEYSRDIEPMEGGHGDQYYRWMIEYISAYKGGKKCPILVEEDQLSKLNHWLKQNHYID